MENKNKVLGILGGLGPMSSAYFYELITSHTKAQKDQDHIDIILSSRATTPDRTDFILGKSADDPSVTMAKEIKKLCDYGADVIAISCNTAHFFYEKLLEASTVPVLNMVEESVQICKNNGVKKVGILATKGTISANIYAKVCQKQNIDYYNPTEGTQELVSKIIYEQIKAGKPASRDYFDMIKAELTDNMCDAAILGCTELSVAKNQLNLGSFYVDSLDALAYSAIVSCGKTPCGFEELFNGSK